MLDIKNKTSISFKNNDKESVLFLSADTTFGELYDIGCQLCSFSAEKIKEMEEKRLKEASEKPAVEVQDG